MRRFSDPSARIADPHLRRAFELAERGRGSTSPNPIVGCVIVRDGQVVGEGWHERAGGPHAEVMALAEASVAAVGSTLYVTLEPCNHEGRTPACAPALASTGVAEVVIGMPDPNPSVLGGGAETLRSKGVNVRFAEDPTPFEEQLEEWVHFTKTGLPFLRAKIALSLDGHAAMHPGKRATITGPGMLAIRMRLRAAADAVLVGAGTLRIDDPSLTVRDAEDVPAERQPLRVVLCRGSLPSPEAKIFTDGLGPALALISDALHERIVARIAERGVPVAQYSSRGGIKSALEVLATRDVVSVLAEPGPTLFGALWDQGVMDELVVGHAGGLAGAGAPHLGGNPVDTEARLRAVRGEGGARSADALERRLIASEAGITADGDTVAVWRPRSRR